MKHIIFYLRFLHGILLLSLVLVSVIFFLGNENFPGRHLLLMLEYLNFAAVVYIIQTVLILLLLAVLKIRLKKERILIPCLMTCLGSILAAAVLVLADSVQYVMTQGSA